MNQPNSTNYMTFECGTLDERKFPPKPAVVGGMALHPLVGEMGRVLLSTTATCTTV